ncbi:MAG: CapA family protein [Trueperaceae bacterium]|nr:CapA family protein [Trueperaceae bacterium]
MSRTAAVRDQVLGIVGDVNVQERAVPEDAFTLVQPLLDACDVRFGHLEGPLSTPSTDPSAPDVPHKPRWRHSDPATVAAYLAAGFDAMGCASNVTYPRRVALDTRRTLEGAGIAPCGVGRNLAEALAPALVTKDGVRYAFLSVTSVFWPSEHAADVDAPGVATVKAYTAYAPGRRALEMPGAPPEIVTFPDADELQALVSVIAELRPRVDVLVVSCHWGVSSSPDPVEYQRAIGRAAIDAGADIVVGHHPHVIQEVELHTGRPIFYSLGNFAFDWPKMRGRNLDGLLLRCSVRASRVVGIDIVPVRRDDRNTIAPLDPRSGAGKDILEHLAERSAANGTVIVDDDGTWSLRDLEVRS